MASHNETKIEGDEQQQPKGEPDLDCLAQQVQNLLKFQNFYDRMDLSADQCLTITKAIIELTDSSGGLKLYSGKAT